MTQPTKEQAKKRWNSLPLILREALYDEPTADFVEQTSAAEHVPPEKISLVSKITGYVLMGFLHPEDVAQELKEHVGLDPQTSAAMQESFSKRIFTPLRADIDKAYSPISKLEAGTGPKIIQDIGPAPKISAPMSVSAIPTQAIPPAPPKPTLADKGWSKISPNDPVIKFAPTQTPPPVPKPAPSSAQAAPQQRPSMPSSSSVGEFARLSQMQKAPGAVPIPPSAPKPPAAASGPAPMMLHEDAKFKTIQGGSDFHLSMPAGNADMMGSLKSQTPVKPAVMDLGKSAAPASGAEASKVVHYTEFKPAASAMPQENAGNRNVMEITAAQKPGFASVPVPIPPAPKPTMSAQPPAPQIPKPPSPGTPPTPGKVINKDY